MIMRTLAVGAFCAVVIVSVLAISFNRKVSSSSSTTPSETTISSQQKRERRLGFGNNDRAQGGGQGQGQGQQQPATGQATRATCVCQNEDYNCAWEDIPVDLAPPTRKALTFEKDGWNADIIGSNRAEWQFSDENYAAKFLMADSYNCGGTNKTQAQEGWAFIHAKAHCDVVLDIDVNGKVGHQGWNADILNIWVDENWAFQARSVQDEKGCVMGHPDIAQPFPERGYLLKRGWHDIAIQVNTHEDLWHKNAFYDMQFLVDKPSGQPFSPETTLQGEKEPRDVSYP